MSTINAVGNGLTGSTGTGNFVGSTSPTLVTPTLGVATATSLAFSPTTNGIVGTTVGDNASAGYVGEFVYSNVPESGSVSIPISGIPTNVTSISLSAGDWDVFGNVTFQFSAATSLVLLCTSSPTSATIPDNSMNSIQSYFVTLTTGGAGMTAPVYRAIVNTTITMYLVAYVAASAGTVTACGSIYARRVR